MAPTDREIESIFRRVHQGLPREAPGSAETTALLVRMAGELPSDPTVFDVGCGTGSATILLAELTGGRVTAVDVHEPYLAEVSRRAAEAGVGDRVSVMRESMDALPVPNGSIDLLWAEGSAYVLGFAAALAAWRPLLSDTGVLVLTEAEFITPDPGEEAAAFWSAGYPAMRSTAQNVAAAQKRGWEVRAVYVLPDSDWDNYYAPLRARIAELEREGVDPEVLAMAGAEIGVRERCGGDYAYTGYVLRPRS